MASSGFYSFTINGSPIKLRSKQSMNQYIVTYLNPSIARKIPLQRNSPIDIRYKNKIEVPVTIYKNLLSNNTYDISIDIINSVSPHDGKLYIPSAPEEGGEIGEREVMPLHMYTLCNYLLHHNTGFVIVKNEDFDVEIYDPPNKSMFLFNGTLDEMF